jgi:hypothetical protein
MWLTFNSSKVVVFYPIRNIIMENLRTSTLATRKKTTLVLFFVIFLIINAYSYSQPSIQWNKIYSPSVSSDEALSICNTGIGYYYIGGHAHDANFVNQGYLLKINELGDTIWSKYFPSWIWAIASTPSNGCIISQDYTPLTFKNLDSNGNIIWNRSFSSQICLVRCIIKTKDGKYIACGVKNSPMDGVIVKFDLNGNLDWVKFYPAGSFKSIVNIEELPNGDFIATGGVKDTQNDTNKILLLKLNSTGDIIWEKKFKFLKQAAYGGYVKYLDNCLYICGGANDSSNVLEKKRNFLLRTDISGNVTFSKLFNYYKQDEFITAKLINQNKFIFSSFSYSQFISQDTSYNRVMITDTLGNIISSRNFYSPLFLNQFYAATTSSNGDILLCGYARMLFRSDDIYVTRVDSNLNGPAISVYNYSNNIPTSFKLYQNFPNPFNPTTTIKFDIPVKSSVTLKIYDLLGREVETILNNEFKTAGWYEVNWNASKYASGVYIYRIEALQAGTSTGDFVQSRKMVLIK